MGRVHGKQWWPPSFARLPWSLHSSLDVGQKRQGRPTSWSRWAQRTLQPMISSRWHLRAVNLGAANVRKMAPGVGSATASPIHAAGAKNAKKTIVLLQIVKHGAQASSRKSQSAAFAR